MRSSLRGLRKMRNASGQPVARCQRGRHDPVRSRGQKSYAAKILDGEPRIDGRDTRTVRPIEIRHGVLPRTHGSALFTRGETQALVTATLGTKQDEQIIDALQGEYRERFMFHYNMPPFATGETGRVGAPRRREIGHGRLAKRALIATLPTLEEFSIRCRGLRDPGIQRLVIHGIGLRWLSGAYGCRRADEGARGRRCDGADQGGQQVRRADRYPRRRGPSRRHDFKVAGTVEGVTALQMDIKIEGITRKFMWAALLQAREGRMHILQEDGRIDGRQPGGELSAFGAAVDQDEDQTRKRSAM